MTTKTNWIGSLMNIASGLLGLIFTLIGSIMLLNSIARLYIFGYETNKYFNASEICEFSQKLSDENKLEKIKNNPKEKKECIAEKTAFEKKKYHRQQTEQIIDGFVFLIVGGPVWIYYRRKKCLI